MPNTPKNFQVISREQMTVEILGVALLELKVGVKWSAEEIDRSDACGVYFHGIDRKNPENEIATFGFFDVTGDPQEKDTSVMNDQELGKFSAFAEQEIGKQLHLLGWGDWFTHELKGGIRAFGVKYKVLDPTVGERSAYSLRATFKGKKYCALFLVNDKDLGFLRFYKFLKQALEGIEFFDNTKFH